MDDKGKRLARNIGLVLAVARWILIAMLVLLLPAMIFSFLMPHVVSLSAILGEGSAPDRAPTSFAAGLILAYALGNLALVLVIVTKLRHMMRTVSTGQPFEPANTTRLRRIAAAMAGLALLPMVVRPIIPALARPSVDMASPNLNLGLWLSALVVLVLAEVFREGTRLREDADMTV